MLNFSNAFFWVYKMIIWFLAFILLIYYINWFSDDKPTLHVWGKSHLSTVQSFLLKKNFFCLLGPHWRHTEVPRHRSNWSYTCRPMTEQQQHGIWAASVTYTIAHGHARFLTHWARPGIEPAPSWMLVRFVNHWATMGTPSLFYMLLDLVSWYCCWEFVCLYS